MQVALSRFESIKRYANLLALGAAAIALVPLMGRCLPLLLAGNPAMISTALILTAITAAAFFIKEIVNLRKLPSSLPHGDPLPVANSSNSVSSSLLPSPLRALSSLRSGEGIGQLEGIAENTEKYAPLSGHEKTMELIERTKFFPDKATVLIAQSVARCQTEMEQQIERDAHSSSSSPNSNKKRAIGPVDIARTLYRTIDKNTLKTLNAQELPPEEGFLSNLQQSFPQLF
jgi:hypothetical protein